MKKFHFSLHALFELKTTMKDKLQSEYAAARSDLDRAEVIKSDLDRLCTEKSCAYEAKAQQGVTPCDIQAHSAYLEQLRQMITAAESEIDQAQKVANQKQTALLELCQEIKAMEKLRRKQYVAYLIEEQKQATAATEDILSFGIAGKPVEQGVQSMS